MAYVVARRGGRFEVRESIHTAEGPRARTLAGFKVLTSPILVRAEKKAQRPFDVQSVVRSAMRAKAPINLSDGVERGARAIHPGLAGAPLDPESKARRLRRFLGPLVDEDKAQAALWRAQSEAAHAEAGAQLSDMAARLAVETGRGKSREEMLPALSSFAHKRVRTAE